MVRLDGDLALTQYKLALELENRCSQIGTLGTLVPRVKKILLVGARVEPMNPKLNRLHSTPSLWKRL